MLLGHDTQLELLETLADQRGLAHGYIFFGPDHVGKRTAALALASYLEMQSPDYAGVLSDLLLIGGDRDTVGIDEIRRVKHFLFQKPFRSAYRTVIIDGAHRLTEEAQQALLKTAEEPPASGLLILIVSDPELLKPTLQSRFQNLYFGSVPTQEIEAWLAKEQGVPAREAKSAAAASRGAPGIAWRLAKSDLDRELTTTAAKFLKLPAASRRQFIKDLIEPEDFDVGAFLDAVAGVLAEEGLKTPRQRALWHAVLELKRNTLYFNLNPRLQLENLLAS